MSENKIITKSFCFHFIKSEDGYDALIVDTSTTTIKGYDSTSDYIKLDDKSYIILEKKVEKFIEKIFNKTKKAKLKDKAGTMMYIHNLEESKQ